MEKRRKKHHPIRNLFIVLGIIVLVVVLPVGALFLLVYDKTENTRVYDSTNITEMGSKALVTGIRSTKQKQKISVEVSKDDLNGVIVDMTSNLNIEQIKKIYALKEDNNVNFYMELEAGPMRSLVTLKTAIVDETDNLEMNIEEVLIGKLKVSKSLANNVFKMFGVKLEAQETNGVTIDFTNWKVILSKDLLLDSLKSGDELISDIFDVIDKNELLSFNTTDPNSIISVDINIDKFKNNPLLTPDDEHLFTNAPSTPYAIMGVDQVSSEIDSKVYYIIKHANITSAQLQPLFEFLFTGYKYSSDANKQVVEAIKTQNPHIFEEVGISDLSTYKSLGDE
ncbi:MAG: hypothetical protein K6F07_01670, partial [Bacilli bacterium]|nr:hypothetical protein [Bacilli bacterium]